MQKLVQQLNLHLECQPTTIHQHLPEETLVAITLLKLITYTRLWPVSHLFRVDKVTTGKTILEVCSTSLPTRNPTPNPPIKHPLPHELIYTEKKPWSGGAYSTDPREKHPAP